MCGADSDAASNVTQLDLCLTVEERARILRIPDATPSTSTTHSATEACLSASTVPLAIKAIAASLGGLAVIGAIKWHYMGDDPNADSIAKVAALSEPASAGSGIILPPGCLSDAQKASLREELEAGGWRQDHHIATDKNRFWTPLFKALLAEHEWSAGQSLNGSWNKITKMLHRGTHPPASHFWVHRNMSRALETSSSWDEFLEKWDAWVVDPISQDPTVIRWEWWRC